MSHEAPKGPPRATLEDRLRRLTLEQRQTLEAAKNAHRRASFHSDESRKHYDTTRLLLWKLRQQGVPIRTLGEALGITHTRVSAITKGMG